MGGRSILGCMEKREILNKTGVPRETLVSWGDTFLEQGTLSDAVDFYVKAAAESGNASSSIFDTLESIRSRAMDEGDLFLFTKVSRALRKEAAAQELRTLAQNAATLGKELYAAQAVSRTGLDVLPQKHSA